MRERLRKLYKLFAHDDRLLILIDADPDSIASALALKRLLWRRVATCVIVPIRPITRPQNQTMVRLLEIPLVAYEKIDPREFSRKALVDSQPSHHERLADLDYDLIIDHHPLHPQTEAPFLDIRPKYGATATILTEYLRDAKIKPSLKLATALFYAIKTDTSNFESHSTEADVRAFHFLFQFTRRALVRRIEIAELTLGMLKYFRRGLGRWQIHHDRLYSFVGSVPTPDLLVMLADFFLRLVEISWSIVAGIYQDKLIVIFRNDGLRKNAGRLANKAFGKLGSAGGHPASARAEIPLEALGEIGQEDEDAWENFLITRVEGK
ncbi:MAG: DHH family phosphoesterase [Deltaproteobacteria bacterium]|nr:DHH family phosphoesterase [Deltaproteobacteria bacterium]MBW1951919.1 DHH family phosphoesterase [Deltaproteobacteria bacterium]MBW1986333.1 DHH family phosphoesterase [Deltaproteobacteria bacterium]MBW2134375.1 DHH family phosphoesterase [Deltaproteobacteria bacterium]